MSTLSLFGDLQPQFAESLAPKLEALARQNIFIGTSSWKYEGWLDQIYTRERYVVRGRFSSRKFEAECLAQYAKTFPLVGGDFSFYQFPSETFWSRLFQSVPPALQFALKAPEEITVRRFPRHERYGARGGLENPLFLNAEALEASFLSLLAPYASRIAAVMFEFGAFAPDTFQDGPSFLQRLDQFLSALPATFRYAVEIRNAEILSPEYFACLHQHGVSHVFNAWTRMPELTVQTSLANSFTANFTVVRGLLRKGRPYEEAVAKFSPYTHVQEPNPEVREAIRQLINRCREERKTVYVLINNRLEGNAPQTIDAIVS